MLAKRFNDEKWIYPFIMRYPKEMKDNLPLIVQLHGAGERGDGDSELSLVEVHGFSHVLTDDVDKDCILVQPQCKKGTFWAADVQSIIRFIEQVAQEFRVDRKRIYLCGISMGAFGTWYTAMACPEMFAAIAPCCGGGMPWNAGVLTMPIWAFHGDDDTVVNVRESIEMVESARLTNDDVKLTIYEGVGHNSWTKAFSSELLNWILSKRKA